MASTSIPTFFAHGHLTDSALWTTSDLPTLIAALIGDGEYLARDSADRLAVREQTACQIATQTQAGLLMAAVQAATFSWEGASLLEISRLTRAREITDRDGSWSGSVPLILVRPQNRSWKTPAGRVKVISPWCDSHLLTGMRDLGWLEDVGRLDSAGGIDGPRKQSL